jgi:hypothetical protein
MRRVADEYVPLVCWRILSNPLLLKTALKCISSIFKNFFLLQYMQAFFKRRPVSQADHALDALIPFTPFKVHIYLDFVAFWVRSIGFFMRHYGDASLAGIKEMILSIGLLYQKAAEVYAVNFSTTRRPKYYAAFRFLVIHAFDPHLMCIPSLHVMVVIRTYTLFRELLLRLGGTEKFSAQINEMRRGAVEITEAVLFIKQHSVNCIPAAMYAMTCLDSTLFNEEEACRFGSELFTFGPLLIKGDGAEQIRRYILNLYRRFISEGKKTDNWKAPLLGFLTELPEHTKQAPLRTDPK